MGYTAVLDVMHSGNISISMTVKQAYPTFCCLYLKFPEQKLTIIVLTQFLPLILNPSSICLV